MFAVFLASALAMQVDAPDWRTFGDTEVYQILLDANSVKHKLGANGVEVQVTAKLVLHKETDIGKSKKATHIIDQLRVSCDADTVHIDEVSVFSSDNQILDSAKNIGAIANPKLENNFISSLIEIACSPHKVTRKLLT